MTVIPNTTLCAIVRDEMVNPAGGIKNFVEETVPYFEKAVIVDTGSIDGTFQYLQDAVKQHSNLTIDQIPFRGYSNSRNHSLKIADTDWIFVLDADERINSEDYEKIEEEFLNYNEANIAFAYNFRHLFPDKTTNNKQVENNIRFFRKKARIGVTERMRFYERYCWEDLVPPIYPEDAYASEVKIKHYLPSKKPLELKYIHWYKHAVLSHQKVSPLKVEGGMCWKQPHPDRKHLVPSKEEMQFYKSQAPDQPEINFSEGFLESIMIGVRELFAG